MTVVTTGSAVKGCVPGLRKHLGGASIMFVHTSPDGLVQPAGNTAPPSGGVIAFDSTNNQYYQNTTGSTWQKIGSVA